MSNQNLTSAATSNASTAASIAAAQADWDNAAAQTASLASQLAAADGTIATLQGQVSADEATIAALEAKLATVSSKPRIRELLYPGCTAKIIGHTELSVNSKSRPVDRSRWPVYDQQNLTDVIAHCRRLKAQGYDALMPNCYKIGSPEHNALLLYLAVMGDEGLEVVIDVDKGVWAGATSASQIQSMIQTYIDTFLAKKCFTLSNYGKWNGKYVVTFFVSGDPPETPAIFANLRALYPQIEFVNNSPANGGGQMSWMKFAMTAADYQAYYTNWLKTYAKKNDGHLYIPHFSPGGDDTLLGHSVWSPTTPPRVCPSIGPNLDFVKWHFAQMNAFYSASNQPAAWIQGVTVNDWDEKTAMEPLADGTGGYFANA